MAWTNAVSDLRSLLNDNKTDRYFYRKKLFGQQNGSNPSFKTFEFRRVTDFTDVVSSAAPLGIYIDGVRLDPSKVIGDNPQTGEFVLDAPTAATITATTRLEATYYTQQFTDPELTEILTNISNSLQQGPQFVNLNPNLWEAALNLAAGDALRKLGMRWTMRASDAFLLDDSPKKEALGVADSYVNLGEVFSNRGIKLRDSAYADRVGQSLAPNFRSNFGRVGAVVPRR